MHKAVYYSKINQRCRIGRDSLIVLTYWTLILSISGLGSFISPTIFLLQIPTSTKNSYICRAE